MGASIVENQRRAYLAQAHDAAFVLSRKLENLSEPQRAAILALVAHSSRTPVDISMLTGEKDDPMEAALIMDGEAPQGTDANWAWNLGSGCQFVVTVTQEDHR